VCEPVSIATAAIGAAGQIAEHNAANNAIEGRNRAKLRNFDEQNKLYDREVMFDRAQYKNDMAIADIDQDRTYQAMIDQWSQADQQLDRLFAQGDQKIEQAIVKMYENDYAGTQTGKTAARLAGKSAKKLGQYKSEVLHNMMMSEEETMMRKEQVWNQAQADNQKIFEKVRFAPIHGPTPIAPELEAKKSSASLILGLAGTAAAGVQQGLDNRAPGIGSGKGTDGLEISAKDYGAWDANAGQNLPSFSTGMTGWEPISSPPTRSSFKTGVDANLFGFGGNPF